MMLCVPERIFYILFLLFQVLGITIGRTIMNYSKQLILIKQYFTIQKNILKISLPNQFKIQDEKNNKFMLMISDENGARLTRCRLNSNFFFCRAT